MKLTRQHTKPGSMRLNMASMVDVVFLLLIFFMCTTSFQRPEERLPAPLPRASSVAKPSPGDDFEPIRIRIEGAGDTFSLRLNDSATTGMGDLLNKLIALHALADVPVIISADEDIDFEHCVKILDLCIKAKFTKVAFRA